MKSSISWRKLSGSAKAKIQRALVRGWQPGQRLVENRTRYQSPTIELWLGRKSGGTKV